MDAKMASFAEKMGKKTMTTKPKGSSAISKVKNVVKKITKFPNAGQVDRNIQELSKKEALKKVDSYKGY